MSRVLPPRSKTAVFTARRRIRNPGTISRNRESCAAPAKDTAAAERRSCRLLNMLLIRCCVHLLADVRELVDAVDISLGARLDHVRGYSAAHHATSAIV